MKQRLHFFNGIICDILSKVCMYIQMRCSQKKSRLLQKLVRLKSHNKWRNRMRISYNPLWKMPIDKGMNKKELRITKSEIR